MRASALWFAASPRARRAWSGALRRRRALSLLRAGIAARRVQRAWRRRWGDPAPLPAAVAAVGLSPDARTARLGARRRRAAVAVPLSAELARAGPYLLRAAEAAARGATEAASARAEGRRRAAEAGADLARARETVRAAAALLPPPRGWVTVQGAAGTPLWAEQSTGRCLDHHPALATDVVAESDRGAEERAAMRARAALAKAEAVAAAALDRWSTEEMGWLAAAEASRRGEG